jgi:tight adherence protein C
MHASFGLSGMLVFVAAFAAVAVLGYFLACRTAREQRDAVARLRELAEEPSLGQGGRGGTSVWRFLQALGTLGLPGHNKKTAGVKTRLQHAGYFHPSAPFLFMGARVLLTAVLTPVVGLAPVLVGLASWSRFPLFALCGCAAGLVGPGLWLSGQLEKRKRTLRDAFPDALDMLVLCMEGGVTLQAAVQRVADELAVVHPVLGAEVNVVHGEMQLGLSAAEALRNFADRCGLDDVRDLACVLQQSEKHGASVAKALRIFSDSARVERQQQAEEMAQKAAVKILFPTLVCIFPAIFIVLLGPAAVQMSRLFAR